MKAALQPVERQVQSLAEEVKELLTAFDGECIVTMLRNKSVVAQMADVSEQLKEIKKTLDDFKMEADPQRIPGDILMMWPLSVMLFDVDEFLSSTGEMKRGREFPSVTSGQLHSAVTPLSMSPIPSPTPSAPSPRTSASKCGQGLIPISVNKWVDVPAEVKEYIMDPVLDHFDLDYTRQEDKRSKQNKKNISKLTVNHAAGSRSFQRTRACMKNQESGNINPAELYKRIIQTKMGFEPRKEREKFIVRGSTLKGQKDMAHSQHHNLLLGRAHGLRSGGSKYGEGVLLERAQETMGRLFLKPELADTLIGNIQSGVSEGEALVGEDGVHCRHAAECCEEAVHSLPSCIKKGKLVCVAKDNPIPIMEVEPLAVCAIQSGSADFSANLDSSDWVLGMVSSFRHMVGLSCEGHEADLEDLFEALEKERGNWCPKTPCKTGSKLTRELKGLKSAINYEGKTYVSRKNRKDGRDLRKSK
ncbi:hypothetical protein CJ030_MR1G028219 [Morella rubra]|uniref:Uncharacterized protein n=1 Tax=Morella rubra TaxID=262757 RepID=A0A6A1WTH4_9ROSI|nr:hypothetical protein CJ030_MR1G028219 [Morella rubra]